MAAHFTIVFFAWGLAQLSVSARRLFPAARHRSSNVKTTSNAGGLWNVFDYLLVIILVTFSAVRYFVGTDYGTYLRLYSSIDSTDLAGSFANSPVEIGYTGLSILVHSLMSYPYAIFWATSILTVIPVYVALKRSSLDLPFSLLIFMLLGFYVSPFNIIREGVAIGLVFLAHTFYGKSKTAYWVLSILAGLFHYTAWLAVIVQWVVLRWRPSIQMVKYTVGVALLASGLLVVLSTIDPALISSILGAVNPRYADYFEGHRSGVGTYLILVARLVLLMVAYLLMKRSGDGFAANWERYGTWFTYVALGICFLTIGTQAVYVGRFDYYFGVFIALLIPNLLKGIDASNSRRANRAIDRLTALATSPRVLKFGFAVLGSVYLAMFIANFSDLVPYKTYLGL